MRKFSFVIFIFALLPSILEAKKERANSAERTFFGKVEKCHDGDTCRVKLPGKTISVRFSGIDSPEIDQAQGKEARDFTENLIKGKDVRLHCDGKSFKRITCQVFDGEIDINQEIVKAGYAFDVPRFSNGRYQESMETARNLKLGIWKYDPTSPYCFRYKKNKNCMSDKTFVGK